MRFLAGGLLLSCVLALGCKQGEGERCQINSDCEEGLTCPPGTEPRFCTKVGGTTVPDAAPAADARIDAVPQVDAGLPDSSIDAVGVDAT
ncbi:MAG: hypothetical protein HY698_14340 [Deltaproteobacteria bacterium]|nr:hypothetical protein [Deltaproteobacteria bacterium]